MSEREKTLTINEIYHSIQGREHLGGFAVRFRAPNILRPSMQLLRYEIRFLRGEQTKLWRSYGHGLGVSVPAWSR